MTNGNNGGLGSGLSALAIRRPVFTTMMMALLVVLGFFSFRRLPIDQFPEVDIPVVVVQTQPTPEPPTAIPPTPAPPTNTPVPPTATQGPAGRPRARRTTRARTSAWPRSR